VPNANITESSVTQHEAALSITESQISDFGTYLTSHQSLAAYAPLASPALTGTPTAPTATAGTNTTQIATTAYVTTAVDNIVGAAPGSLDTLNELAAALGDDANFSTTVTNSIATKLPLAGGTMTGALTVNAVNNTYNFKALGQDTDSWFGVYDDANNSANIILTRSDGATMFRVMGHTGATTISGALSSGAIASSGNISGTSGQFGTSSVPGSSALKVYHTANYEAATFQTNQGGSLARFIDSTAQIEIGIQTGKPVIRTSNAARLTVDGANVIINSGALLMGSTTVINASRTVNNVTLGALATGARFETNNWHQDSGGTQRLYFENAGRTFYKAGSNHIFRNSGDSGVATIDTVGRMRLATSSDQTSIGAGLQVGNNTFTGANGVYANGRLGIMLNGSLKSYVYASTYNDATYPDYGFVFIHGGDTSSYNVWSISPDGPAKGDSLNFIYGSNATNIHTATPKVVFDGNGNVGIGTGTSAPSKTLHVKTTGNEGIRLEGTNAGVWMDVQSSNSELWSMGADTNGWAVYNRTDSAYRLRVENGGDVDIVSGGLKVGASTVIDSSRNVIAASLRPSVDNAWKIRGNSGNANLAFEYSTSTGLADANIKAEIGNTGNVIFGARLSQIVSGYQAEIRKASTTIGDGGGAGALNLRATGNFYLRHNGSDALTFTSSAVTASKVIASALNGNNTTGGNILLGATGNNAAKWGSVVMRQYNSDTETEGYSLITGATGNGVNRVDIGGGLDEQNAATVVYVRTAANTSTRSGTEIARFTSSGFDVRNNNIRITGTTVIDSSRNLSNIGSATISGAYSTSSTQWGQFTGNGSATYTLGAAYCSSSEFSLEAPLTTNASGGAHIPIYLTWRGGYSTQGGIKITDGLTEISSVLSVGSNIQIAGTTVIDSSLRMFAGSGTQTANGDAPITIREGNAFAGFDFHSARTSGNIGGLRWFGTSSNSVPEAQLLVETNGALRFYNGSSGAQNTFSVDDGGNTSTSGKIRANGIAEFRHIEIERTQTNAGIWFAGTRGNTTDTNHVVWNDYAGGPTTKGGAGSGFDGIKWNSFSGLQVRGGSAGAYDIARFDTEGSGSSNTHFVRLYQANSEKLRTTSDGITVKGAQSAITIDPDNQAGYVSSRIRLSSHDQYRGAGVYMRCTADGDQWFAGSPYSDFDGYYMIGFQSGITSDLDQTAQLSHYKFRVDASGNCSVKSSLQVNGTTVIDSSRNGLFSGVEGTAVGVDNTSSSTKRGLALYGGYGGATNPTYGLMFTGTSGSGTHGSVTGDWATYFTMNASANRGWIFKTQGVANVASISNTGNATFNGTISSGDGTATAPAYTFSSDTNTGMFSGGADVLKFTTGGTNGLTINATDVVLLRDNVYVKDYLRHYGDTNTYFRFTTDRIRMVAGGVTYIDAFEGTTDYLRFPTRAVVVGNNTSPLGAMTIEHDSTDTPAAGGDSTTFLRFDNSNTTASASTVIAFNANDAGGNTRHGAGIQFKKSSNWANSSGSYPGELYFWTRPSSGNQVAAQKLDKDGNAIFKGNVTAYGSLSDRRLKQNIENISDAVNKVQDLNGVTFEYKKDGNRATGLIAQDLEKVLPEAVYTSSDIETGEEHKAIHYGNVVGLLVEAIKELKQEIEDLKNGDNKDD